MLKKSIEQKSIVYIVREKIFFIKYFRSLSSDENLELSQYQSKLIDAHQKQMQIMKKELDDGYHNVINEFQHEQTRLQTRCDQLKQQLNNAEQTIEQLKLNLNQFKTNHHDEISRVKELNKNEKYTFENGNRNRLEHLVKLLEQSNTA
jgi:uncharacterized protein YPO0396